jgi:cytoskeletal protein RodZ
MNRLLDTRSYDLLKAIVVLILLIILILLLLRGAPTPATPLTEAPAASDTPTSASQVQPTATSRPVQPSPTPTIEPAETILSAPTPTEAPDTTVATTTETPATSPEPTTAPAATEAPTEAPEQISVDCPLALPTRLKVGDTVRVNSNLNMRVSAGIGSSLIRSNITGTQLTIIGGPVCEPYQDGAYLWWQVQRPDEESGWSAEGSSTELFYFLEPVE